MRWMYRIGLVLLLLLLGAAWWVRPLLQVGAGYAAKMACSCHYLQGRTLADIQANDLNFSALPMVSLRLDEGRRTVTADFGGVIRQTAIYRDGHGCTLLPASGDLPSLPARAPAAPTLPLPKYDTLPPSLDMARIQRQADAAFDPLPGGGTRALLILHDGRLVYERYAPGIDADTPLLGWSMTKSITNALVGMLVKNGRLQLTQDHLFPEWEGDARAQITLTDLLQMNSGLRWDETYGSVSDATRMLYLQPDMGGFASTAQQEQPHGTHWVYSSGTTNILSRLIRQTLNDDVAYHALLYDSLFQQVGMTTALVETDASGSFVGSSYGWATAADWARFGQLYLQDGIANGQRILPEGWVDFSRQAASGSAGIYGAQIWLRTEDATSAPEDVFQFRGFQDQRVVVIPSRQLVIVRLGMNEDKAFDLDALLRGI